MAKWETTAGNQWQYKLKTTGKIEEKITAHHGSGLRTDRFDDETVDFFKKYI